MTLPPVCPTCRRVWRTATNTLTPRQAALLSFIRERVTAAGVAPTYAEMCERFGWTSEATPFEIVSRLEAKGWVNRNVGSRRFRGVDLTERGRSFDPAGVAL